MHHIFSKIQFAADIGLSFPLFNFMLVNEIQNIQAKTILQHVKHPDPYFGIKYNMNLYRGCQHACIYCDTRSECYGIVDISKISVKENALDLLQKEIKSKRKKGTIGFGSMNDCYMPIEKKYQYTCKALEIIKQHRFPIHIITKSNLVTRDMELLQEINKIYAAITFTITCADDNLSKNIELNAPVSSERFKAMETLSKNGIYTGVIVTPILPFINDNWDNVGAIIQKAKDSGAQYIFGWMAVTMRDTQRKYFYNELDKRYPGLKQKYIVRFGNQYGCASPNAKELEEKFNELCYKLNIDTRMKFYEPNEPEQMQLKF